MMDIVYIFLNSLMYQLPGKKVKSSNRQYLNERGISKQ